MGKISYLLCHPKELMTSVLSHYGTFIPDEAFLKLTYRIKMGEKLDLDNPRLFTEKLQWYKLHDHNPLYTRLVDKYEVRSYVSEKIGEDYLVPIYGVWDRFDDINFDELPEQFVLKCTHDSGGMQFCLNKPQFDIDHARKVLSKCLKHRFYWFSREWAYKNVPPRIIAQKYISSLGKPDSVEYKLTCFDGKVKLITVCTGIAHDSFDVRTNDNFDRDFNPLPFYAYYKNSGKTIEKPAFMDEMIRLSEKLSDSIPQVRVDWFVVDGHIFFGEMTFYTWAGYIKFTPEKWNEIMGDWFNLPAKDRWDNVYIEDNQTKSLNK